jgi:hypothetical protein
MLDKTDEISFIHYLNLEGLKTFGDGYICRCPICGDSQKSKNKKRFYILNKRNEDNLRVMCHNCSYANSFKYFLREVNPFIFSEYCKKERDKCMKEGKIIKSKRKDTIINSDTKIKYEFKLNSKYFIPAKEVKECIEYCNRRKISLNNLYYCTHPKQDFGNMLIFPFWKGHNVYGFQGRRLDTKRFFIHSPNDNYKVWGLFDIEDTKPVIVCEAIIDAMMINNSIAMLGSDLSHNIQNQIKDKDVIYAFDNDTTGIRKALKYVIDKKNVFIWPVNLHYKDFNEAVLDKDFTKDELTNIIIKNTKKGLEASTILQFMLKNRKR